MVSSTKSSPLQFWIWDQWWVFVSLEWSWNSAPFSWTSQWGHVFNGCHPESCRDPCHRICLKGFKCHLFWSLAALCGHHPWEATQALKQEVMKGFLLATTDHRLQLPCLNFLGTHWNSGSANFINLLLSGLQSLWRNGLLMMQSIWACWPSSP
jgi:hypothetical protein